MDGIRCYLNPKYFILGLASTVFTENSLTKEPTKSVLSLHDLTTNNPFK